MCMKSCKAAIRAKMVEFYKSNVSDIEHFLKVYAYAQTLGELENLDGKTQDILEIAAIVHDIACPLCREKYGNTDGKHQEAESEKLLIDFLAEFDLPGDIQERVIYLVCRHHTYEGVEGIDWQLLLEADFLVNALEMKCSRETILSFRDKVFKSKSGLKLLNEIYLK